MGNAGAWPHDRKAAKFFGDEHKLDHVSLFLKWKDMEESPEGDFYVRSGPGTVRLDADSARDYIRTRFNPGV